MSNRQRRLEQERRQRVRWVWSGLAAVVVLALVVAVVVSSDGDGDDADGVEQVAAVEASGDALPAFDASAATDPAKDVVAPELRGRSFDGTPVDVTRDGRGKVIVFLAHWCPHCQAEVPRIVAHLADRALPTDVDLVAVSTAVDENRPNYPASTWLERERWTWPVLVDDADGSAAAQFGLSGFPYLVALDPEGRVVARTSGEFSMTVFDAAVAAAR